MWAIKLQALCSEVFDDCEIVCASNWMTAVPDIKSSDLVLIDWLLDNDVTADDCGAISLLNKLKIQHAIVTSSPEYVPEHVTSEIVSKDEDKIIQLLKDKRDALITQT